MTREHLRGPTSDLPPNRASPRARAAPAAGGEPPRSSPRATTYRTRRRTATTAELAPRRRSPGTAASVRRPLTEARRRRAAPTSRADPKRVVAQRPRSRLFFRPRGATRSSGAAPRRPTQAREGPAAPGPQKALFRRRWATPRRAATHAAPDRCGRVLQPLLAPLAGYAKKPETRIFGPIFFRISGEPAKPASAKLLRSLALARGAVDVREGRGLCTLSNITIHQYL